MIFIIIHWFLISPRGTFHKYDSLLSLTAHEKHPSNLTQMSQIKMLFSSVKLEIRY